MLDDTAVVAGYENTYHRLANDPGAKYGLPYAPARVARSECLAVHS